MNREEEMEKAWGNMTQTIREYPDIICQIENECFQLGFNAAWDLLMSKSKEVKELQEEIHKMEEKIKTTREEMGKPKIFVSEKKAPKFKVGDRIKLKPNGRKGFLHQPAYQTPYWLVQFDDGSEKFCPEDWLIKLKPKLREFWVNIYESYECHFRTKEAAEYANKCNNTQRTECIRVREVRDKK